MIRFFCLICICLGASGVSAGQTQITLLEGKAFLDQITPLKQGDFVHEGQTVKTAKNSRMELKLPDGSILRLAEKTMFKFDALEADSGKRNISLTAILGAGWIKASKWIGRNDFFKVKTPTAVAAVRGTVYHLNVDKDKSAQINVYQGQVAVTPLFVKVANSMTITPPKHVAGPTTIAGPREVDPLEWSYLLKAMQKITIKPNGLASKPVDFSTKEDHSAWVRWNQLRDQK